MPRDYPIASALDTSRAMLAQADFRWDEFWWTADLDLPHWDGAGGRRRSGRRLASPRHDYPERYERIPVRN